MLRALDQQEPTRTVLKQTATKTNFSKLCKQYVVNFEGSGKTFSYRLIYSTNSLGASKENQE